MRLVLNSFLSTLFTTITIIGGFNATAHAQSSRTDAINASQELFETALALADEVRSTCGCPNTTATLEKIADAATEVELEARFGSRADATAKLKDVIRGVRNLRQYLPHIPNSSLRLRLKREILIAVNSAGSAVMGGKWAMVYADRGAGSSEDSVLDTSLNGVEQNLSVDVDTDF